MPPLSPMSGRPVASGIGGTSSCREDRRHGYYSCATEKAREAMQKHQEWEEAVKRAEEEEKIRPLNGVTPLHPSKLFSTTKPRGMPPRIRKALSDH